jgi:nucleoside phosphorylase
LSGGVLVACALKKETRALRARFGEGTDFLTTGLGTDRTLATLERVLDESRPALLLFTGMGGQLDPTLDLGDFVVPAQWLFESGTVFPVDELITAELRAQGWEIRDAGLTVRTPVVKEKERLRFYRETGARICDMESAAAMMIARSYGVPCLAPKVVSDTADSGMLSFYRNFDRNMGALGAQLERLLPLLRRLVT